MQPFDVSTTQTQLSPGFMAQYQHEHAFGGMAAGHEAAANSSPGQVQLISTDHDAQPVYNMDPYLQMMSARVRVRPLDSQSSRSARLIGETGESTPYLLRHYRYDENDECTISKLTYRRIRKTASQNALHHSGKAEAAVMFMLADDTLAQKGEPRVEDDVLIKARSDINAMCSEQEALRLIGLFFQFVYPYFPILSKSEFFSSGAICPTVLHTMPLSLLSAIYATALPFMLYDDLLATTIVHSPPPVHELFRISWLAVTQELHTPRLATVQACLLLLQRAPTNRYTTDTPWKTSLVGWTVSLAQTLGLTLECGDWTTIPTWEISLRRRLWNGVLIMDKWASLGAGMPSHISAEDFDVLPLSDADEEPASQKPSPNGIPSFMESDYDGPHFRLLAELTSILSDIMDSYFSIRATQRTSRDFALSLDLARPLRSRLKAWVDSLPAALALRQPERVDSRGMVRLSGNPSLSLAYIVATMTLFRALLRPLENLSSLEQEDSNLIGSRLAVRAGAKACAKEAVEFAENLARGALDAFWHSCKHIYPPPPLFSLLYNVPRLTISHRVPRKFRHRLFLLDAAPRHGRERS